MEKIRDLKYRYLGVDLGKRYIGYAYSNGKIIYEIEIKKYSKLRTALLSEDVYNFIKKYEINIVVIGFNQYIYKELYSDYFTIRDICREEDVILTEENEDKTSSMFKRKFRDKGRVDSLSAMMLLERHISKTKKI